MRVQKNQFFFGLGLTRAGAAVPDLDRIIKMSDLFGVSVDYLVKDDESSFAYSEVAYTGRLEESGVSENMGMAEEKQFSSQEADMQGKRTVSAQEAKDYMELVERAARKIATGVTLCILSPVLLIFLGGLAEYFPAVISEGMAGGIGVTALLCIIAVAVSLFIMNGLSLERYEYLEKEEIILDESIRNVVEKRKAEHEPKFQKSIALGVIICIISVIPLVGISCVIEGEANEFPVVCCVVLLLVMVSVGVHIIVNSAMIRGSYQKLLQEGDYTRTMKEDNKKIEAWAGVYWCIVTAIYLWLSFTGRYGWDKSWIIWPVAGVIFGAISGIIRLVSSGKK